MLIHLLTGLLAMCPAQPRTAMHWTIGNDVELQVKPLAEAREKAEQIAAGAKAAGVTAFEPYVKWMLLEPEPGRWDFTYYDMLLDAYRPHGLKWVPFVIAGPAYATPKWFKDGPDSVLARCLEHDQETRTQSIWNPALPERVDALMKAFAGHFAHEEIQALLIGVSGDFGESIYTVSGNYWTYIWDGEYHHHPGWWCGDAHAIADFRRHMRERYGDIAALNRAWSTTLASFDEVKPFIPTPQHARRARLDMTRWYRSSMTAFTETWLRICRKHLPRTQLLICTGGNGDPALGADFSEQAIMAARHGAGIRITNEASDYANNFCLTRWVGSACRNLGIYFGYEPAGPVDDRGIVARIYNAVASGADELFVYDNPPAGPRGDIYARHRHLLVRREPRVRVALFLSKTAQELGAWGHTYGNAAQLRDYVDIDFVDESLIRAGFLKRYDVLVWLDGPITEAATLDAMHVWASSGGRMYVGLDPEDVEGNKWRERLAEGGAYVNPGIELRLLMQRIDGENPGLMPDGKPDRVYWTTFQDGSHLVLNYRNEPIQLHGRTLPPADIAELPAITTTTAPGE